MVRSDKSEQASPEGALDSEVRPKAILLFSDGTGNSSGKLFKTNVWRMYEAVDLGLPRKGERVQIAYYDNGIGTSKNKVLAILGGVFGFGLQRNVLAIYRYVCRNYEKGDSIYAFGFSRGAFTIRIVAALLATRGVVPYEDEAELNARTRDVFFDFQKENKPNLIKLIAKLGRADREAMTMLKRLFFGPKHKIVTHFEPVKIDFLGVWDTVAAYGGPSAEITRAIDNFIYPLTMTDHCLNEQVQVARHALAIDDERDAFHPVLWDEHDWRRKTDKAAEPGTAAHRAFLDRLQQVWFAGVHSDVGGGYPDESLSFVSLLWMMEEAKKSCLRLLPGHVRRIRNLSNSLGPIHNSRGGVASYYRYQPRKVDAFFHKSVSQESYESTQSMRDPVRGELDYPPAGYLLSCKVHESVAARIALGTDDYAPIVLPRQIEIVPFNSDGGGNPRIDADIKASLETASENWMNNHEAVYDKVWGRRLTYFATVIATVLLVAMPLYAQLFRYPGAADDRWILERLTSWTHHVLPGFLQPWVMAWETAPYLFWFLAGLTLVGWLTGRWLEGSIRSDMHDLWKKRVEKPFADADPRSPSRIQTIRNSKPYQYAVQDLKWYILPVVAGITLLLGLCYALLVVDAQISLSFAERTMCARTAKKADVGAPVFEASDLCNATARRVVRGHHYGVEFAIPGPALRSTTGKWYPWSDGRYPTEPAGLPAYKLGLKGYLGAPFRRLTDTRYLQPVYEIRPDDDADKRRKVIVKALNPTFTEAEGECLIYRADFVAAEDGALFLFANDVWTPWAGNFFYTGRGELRFLRWAIPIKGETGNRGFARVHIHDFSAIRPAARKTENGSRCNSSVTTVP
jgi:uncharacterized protein (DUF2235 family)